MKTKQQTPYQFFKKHADFSWIPERETEAQGKARCARKLAKAEAEASAAGFSFEW